MARVHPQDSVDVLQAARRNATYDCEFVLDAVRPANLSEASHSVTQGADEPMSRLVAAVAGLQRVAARFEFGLDDYARPVVRGEVTADVLLPCQRCLEEVSVRLATPLHSVIWLSAEPPAKELALAEADLVVSRTASVSFAALVEDDLLLALPDRVCQQDDCAQAPVLSYPAQSQQGSQGRPQTAGASDLKDKYEDKDKDKDKDKDRHRQIREEQVASDRQLPFAGLRDLLDDAADT